MPAGCVSCKVGMTGMKSYPAIWTQRLVVDHRRSFGVASHWSHWSGTCRDRAQATAISPLPKAGSMPADEEIFAFMAGWDEPAADLSALVELGALSRAASLPACTQRRPSTRFERNESRCSPTAQRVGNTFASAPTVSAATKGSCRMREGCSPQARSTTPTCRDLSAFGLAIATEPIAIERGANARHGAVSVLSLSDCRPVVPSLRGGTSPVPRAYRHLALAGGLRPWPPAPSFDCKDLSHIVAQSERAAESPFAISGRLLCSAPSLEQI